MVIEKNGLPLKREYYFQGCLTKLANRTKPTNTTINSILILGGSEEANILDIILLTVYYFFKTETNLGRTRKVV